MKHKSLILALSLCPSMWVSAGSIPVVSSHLIGDRIAEFVPEGFDSVKAPSLILKSTPVAISQMPADWVIKPEFDVVDGNAGAVVRLSGNVSLYGGGEVVGPLLRNGKDVMLWNVDNPALSVVDNGRHLYQSHPWVLGVRDDGTAFGLLFDSFWKSELYTNDDAVIFRTQGAPFKVYVIDRSTPQEVMMGLAELTGTMEMPPRWALGYHQCRFSYDTEARVRDIAHNFRSRRLPCDVIWMDIDYMDGYRIFTFDPVKFPNPKALNDDLHRDNFKAVYMIDPGAKVDSAYFVYQQGSEKDLWVKRASGEEFNGNVWPGSCAFPDFTMPEARKWWSGLYADFMALGIDGVWNDMNEPAVFDNDLPEDERTGTMPVDNIHRGGGNLPAGKHLMYHNAYGRLMVEASRNGILAANPDKRPFVLSRSNLLGGQRYAAAWTGDNLASVDQMKMSVPMSITLGLSGQPFNGPDIGGFLENTDAELWANWLGFGVFLPFARGHACAGTNDKEPWAFGPAIESSSRIALERRYRLLPYLYTCFYDAHTTGMPIMQPVFFVDPKDKNLRAEDQVFMMGDNLMVIPAFAKNPAMPAGIWEDLTLIDGDMADKYQARLKLRGGSIIPAGKVVQSTEEKMLAPLTLFVCPDVDGYAEGELYWDKGDGWDFRNGNYALIKFSARRSGDSYIVSIQSTDGYYNVDDILDNVEVVILSEGKKSTGNGSLLNSVIKI